MTKPSRTSAILGAWVAAAVALVTPIASAHDKGDENKPPPEVQMRVIAPSAKGAWLLRIDNEGDTAVMIGADVRLLSFEVAAPLPAKKLGRGKTYDRSAVCDGPKAFGLDDHFPADRELILEPHQSFVEEFDPRLICFGKQADMLVPGARVKPYLGWKPKPVWQKRMETAPFVADAASRPRKYRPLRRLEAPTIVLSHGAPAEYGPERSAANAPPATKPATKRTKSTEPKLTDTKSTETPPDPKGEGAAPGEERGYGPQGTRSEKGSKKGDGGYGPRGTREPPPRAPPTEGASKPPDPTATKATKAKPRTAEEASEHRPRSRVPKPKTKPPAVDQLAARLSLTTSHYADAVRPTDIATSVQAHNVGQRPLFVAMRGRMLSFTIQGPDGPVECPQPTVEHKVPRDLFRLMHHGTHIHMAVMIGEVCPPGTFDRPGLYTATPTLHANAEGKEYGLSAATGTATTRDPGPVSGTHEERDDATLIRIRKGRLPFYKNGAQSMPTRVLPGGERAKEPEEKPAEPKAAAGKDSR